ncbi:hypothetical protein SprV_0100091800 [Sparganum proliferum]
MGGTRAKKPGPCTSQCRSTILYAWAHNGAPLTLPKGSAFEMGRLTKTKSLSMEVHYMRRQTEPDYATIELTFTYTPTPYHAGILLMFNAEGSIPPHSKHFATNISCSLETPAPIYVIGVRTHAHALGRAVVGYYKHPGERGFHLLARGNPQWPQTFYRPSQLSAPSDYVELDHGDLLLARCVYDSTNRSRTTEMGSTNADEMCNLYLMYIMDSKYELPEDSELCADEMVPGAWRHPPQGSFDYAPESPPPVFSKEKLELELDPDWRVNGIRLGQVGGIAVAETKDGEPQLLIFHRGENVWDDSSFDEKFIYQGYRASFVSSPIVQVDPYTGRVVDTFGDNLFVLPHGISVARNGKDGSPEALWVTDVALHQVMQFSWGKWSEPTMILGKRGVPGRGPDSFCQPADVAVASTGEIFVADGYCNQRIVKFSADGEYITSWGVGGRTVRDRGTEHGFQIVHSLTIISPEEAGHGAQKGIEQICATDRERGEIDCYDLNGTRISKYDDVVLQPTVYSIAYSPLYKLIFGVTGPEKLGLGDQLRIRMGLQPKQEVGGGAFAFHPILLSSDKEIPPRGIAKHVDSADNTLLSEVSFHSAHDLDLMPDGSALFVAELRPPYVWKLNIQNSGAGYSPVRSKASLQSHGSTPQPDSSSFSSSSPGRTLLSKLLITGLLALLCLTVIVISVLLVRARHHEVWSLSKRTTWLRRTRQYAGHGGKNNGRSGKSRRYGRDEFRPLNQEESHGLDSDEEYDDEDVEDADTVIDIRRFAALDGLRSSLATTASRSAANATEPNGVAASLKPTAPAPASNLSRPDAPNPSCASNHHIDT